MYRSIIATFLISFGALQAVQARAARIRRPRSISPALPGPASSTSASGQRVRQSSCSDYNSCSEGIARGPVSQMSESRFNVALPKRATGSRVAPTILGALLAAWLGAPSIVAAASALDELSSKDAAGGLRAALSQGVGKAVSELGKHDGFLNDPKVSIPLPATLEKADHALRLVGMSGEADKLRVTMNHAAENAVAKARPVFENAVRHMTLADAKTILTGGSDTATQYLRRTTSAQLATRFKPIVAAETAKLSLATKYNQFAGRAAQFGLIPKEDADLNEYVTAKALDGLFSRIADEERAIRKDPLGQANELIKKVFGAL